MRPQAQTLTHLSPWWATLAFLLRHVQESFCARPADGAPFLPCCARHAEGANMHAASTAPTSMQWRSLCHAVHSVLTGAHARLFARTYNPVDDLESFLTRCAQRADGAPMRAASTAPTSLWTTWSSSCRAPRRKRRSRCWTWTATARCPCMTSATRCSRSTGCAALGPNPARALCSQGGRVLECRLRRPGVPPRHA